MSENDRIDPLGLRHENLKGLFFLVLCWTGIGIMWFILFDSPMNVMALGLIAIGWTIWLLFLLLKRRKVRELDRHRASGDAQE